MPRAELPVLWHLEEPHDFQLSRQRFNREAARIRNGYASRRLSTRYLPPWNTANGYLQREVYRLVRHFDRSGHGGTIRNLVRDLGKEPQNLAFEQNIFHWGLLALEGPQGSMLNPQKRRLFANQMLYAHRHDVPELYLIGFIYQLGSQPLNIHERVASGRTARMVLWLREGGPETGSA